MPLLSLIDAMVTLGFLGFDLVDPPEIENGVICNNNDDINGTTSFMGTQFKVGQYVDAVIIDSMGADLVAKPL